MKESTKSENTKTVNKYKEALQVVKDIAYKSLPDRTEEENDFMEKLLLEIKLER